MLKRIIKTIKNRLALKVPHPTHWARVIMNEKTTELIRGLDYKEMSAMEISGDNWKDFGFRSYQSENYPEFDITAGILDKQFDIILADQVFEHVAYPYRAAKNVYKMLKPGGYFLVTTPFLLKIHDCPIDCNRWSPLGMKYFLEEAGFSPGNIITEGWGNQACVKSNFKKWTNFNKYLHPLRNEYEFPVVVWGLAKK